MRLLLARCIAWMGLSCAMACGGEDVEPSVPPVVVAEKPPRAEVTPAAHEPDLLVALGEACGDDGPIPDDLVLVFSAGGRDPRTEVFFDRAIEIVGTRARGRPMSGRVQPDPRSAPWSAVDDWAETELTAPRVRRAWCELMRSIANTAFEPPRRCQPAFGDRAVRIRASWGERRFVRELRELPRCGPYPIQHFRTQMLLEADLANGPLPVRVAVFVKQAPIDCGFDSLPGSVEARVRYGRRGVPSAVDVLGDLPAPARACIARLAGSVTLRDFMAPSESGRTESYELAIRWFHGRPRSVPILEDWHP